MGINEFFINRLVKSAGEFSPEKKVKGGFAVYDLSMTLLATILLKYARMVRSINTDRLQIL